MRRLSVALASLALAACRTFAPNPLVPEELTGAQSRTVDEVTATVAILTRDQARQHFGVDLAAHEIQAVWISIRNAGDRRLWFIRNLLDPDFYSADEAALMVRSDLPEGAFERAHQYFRDEEIRAQLLPARITEGFVFVPLVEGGRYLDLRLQGDAWDEESAQQRSDSARAVPARELRIDFAVPLPDGEFDYERLDANQIYGGRELPQLDRDGLRAALERLPCCATDADGERNGDPLNIVFVGDDTDVLNALSRSGWSFTHQISLATIRREIGAAVAGTAYPVAPVSSLYAFGRRHDFAMQRARRSIAQRNHLRLWLAPFRYEGRKVWVGQISRDIGIKLTLRSPTITTHAIDPGIDTAREYLLHSLLAQGFVERFGFVRGSAAASPARPLENLTGDPYFSDGMRLVVLLSPGFVAPDEVHNLLWEQSAAPIAEGQSEAAGRYVRPIEPEAVAPSPD